MRWVCEASVFGSGYAVPDAARRLGHAVSIWDDEWWSTGRWAASEPTLFHGSLANAARIAAELPWRPGAYCNVAAFHCSSWYPRAKNWLLHDDWRVLPADRLVAEPPRDVPSVFVRPDSPLKPFSGRVLRTDAISLAALDHGFYYDDSALPVIVAPVRNVGREWRFVVADREVVAGSAYAAEGRRALPETVGSEPWAFAAKVAAELDPPEDVYVLDVCESDGRLRLLELNPFSGADLYACDADSVVSAVSRVAERG